MRRRKLSLSVLLALTLAAPAEGQGARALTGEVVGADGGSVAGVRVSLRGAAFADSTRADSAGRFSLPLPAGAEADTLELSVTDPDSAGGRYHPARVRVARGDLREEEGIVLVPREWAIPAGAYAGVRVEISLARAFLPVCVGCTSFFRPAVGGGTGVPRDLVRTWPEEAFPLRVAFDREDAPAPITARDSVRFWRGVEEMEAVFGSDLFRPARYAEAFPGVGDTSDDVVLVQVDPALRGSGLGISTAFGSEIVYGEVRVRWGRLLDEGDARMLVAHELMHALGLGHTCSWRSVLADLRCRDLSSPVPTAEDVAYAQLARRVRQLQREHGARWGLQAALAGETG